jgi:hypothetical protein
MAIASAVERGGWVYVYDERGRTLTTFPGASQPGEGLQGYTSTTVSVKRGGWINVYDERGNIKTTFPAG